MRNVFLVIPQIVDANGNHSIPSGYPKSFDSRNYGGDIDKTQRRAEGEMSSLWSDYCKRDDRQLQSVCILTADGERIMGKSYGTFAENLPPEPETETEVTGNGEN